jgi:hypothetical protein
VAFGTRQNERELAPRGASSLNDAVRPLLAFPALGSQAVGAASASCYRVATPEGMNGVPSKRPSGRFRPSTTRAIRLADAPCRIPPTGSASRARLRVPGSASPRSTKSAAPRTRSVFHQQVPPSRPALTELLRVDRHRYRRLIANGPTSDMRSRSNPRSARPSCLPAIHRGRGATCRLPASAMYCSPSTPSPRPTSDGNAANRFPSDDSVPFEPPPAELPQVRGHLACFTASTPIARDRSPRWIYPNLTGSSTLCHETVPRWKWNTASLAVLR